MKKADAKKKILQAKNLDRQKKHLTRVKRDLRVRSENEQHRYDSMYRKIRNIADVDARDERIKDKLRHNMEILSMLEGEMDKEAEEKRRTNEELEAKGFLTLEDKMKYLSEVAAAGKMAEAADTQFQVGGEAKVFFRENP